jgi:hypothetical protein
MRKTQADKADYTFNINKLGQKNPPVSFYTATCVPTSTTRPVGI